MKIAINNCYGGFSLSVAAFDRLVELGDVDTIEVAEIFERLGLDRADAFYEGYRHNPLLIQTIEELGENANGRHSFIKIVEIPDGTSYMVQDYDGMEWIAETHRTWR